LPAIPPGRVQFLVIGQNLVSIILVFLHRLALRNISRSSEAASETPLRPHHQDGNSA